MGLNSVLCGQYKENKVVIRRKKLANLQQRTPDMGKYLFVAQTYFHVFVVARAPLLP